MCDFRVIEQDFANDPQKCVCKTAVFNAYNGMINLGQSKKQAMEAAMKVYRYHHPKDSVADSTLTVERWVLAQTLH